jgi:mono/diheme cytochrome c family protein
MSRLMLAVISAVLLAVAANAASAADSANGEKLAKRWCAFCHVVAPGQRRGSDAVPTFAAIGGRMDAKAIAAFIMSPHPAKMPNLSLTRDEAAELAAYIKSQAN